MVVVRPLVHLRDFVGVSLASGDLAICIDHEVWDCRSFVSYKVDDVSWVMLLVSSLLAEDSLAPSDMMIVCRFVIFII